LFNHFYFIQKALTAPNSSINANNFDEKLSQAVFDKCVSREIFQELPGVIDSVSKTMNNIYIFDMNL
jgi:hypothetical protein